MSAVIEASGAEASSPEGAPWFVVEAQPQREGLLQRQLTRAGLEAEALLVRGQLLFPRYLFLRAQLTPDVWHLVHAAPGFLRFVGCDPQRPQPLRPGAMQALRLHAWRLGAEPVKQRYDPGEWLRVKTGLLAGQAGICRRVRPSSYDLLIDLLGRPVNVTVSAQHLEPLH